MTTIRNWVIEKLLVWMNHKLGGLVQIGAGAVVGWLLNVVLAGAVTWLLQHGIALPEETVNHLHAQIEGLRETMTMLGSFAVVCGVQWVQNRFGIQIQAHLGLPKAEQDGYIGPLTVKQAEIVSTNK